LEVSVAVDATSSCRLELVERGVGRGLELEQAGRLGVEQRRRTLPQQPLLPGAVGVVQHHQQERRQQLAVDGAADGVQRGDRLHLALGARGAARLLHRPPHGRARQGGRRDHRQQHQRRERLPQRTALGRPLRCVCSGHPLCIDLGARVRETADG
jgi:hypothetical protein